MYTHTKRGRGRERERARERGRDHQLKLLNIMEKPRDLITHHYAKFVSKF